jgi:polar amino acid transport system permease protein
MFCRCRRLISRDAVCRRYYWSWLAYWRLWRGNSSRRDSCGPKGQTEAALSLNISPLQCFTHVVLPQAIIHAIPPGTNLLIELLKNTSLVSLITLSDLTFRAGQLDQLTGNTLQIMGLTLLFYFVMAQILVAVMRLVDRRFQPGRKKRKAA